MLELFIFVMEPTHPPFIHLPFNHPTFQLLTPLFNSETFTGYHHISPTPLKGQYIEIINQQSHLNIFANFILLHSNCFRYYKTPHYAMSGVELSVSLSNDPSICHRQQFTWNSSCDVLFSVCECVGVCYQWANT